MRSLVYLYNLAEAYIVHTHYYEPDALDKKMVEWPDVKTEEGSALTRFTAKNDVCTFYSVNGQGISLLSNAFDFFKCLPFPRIRFGNRSEKRHADWHNNENEFSIEHMHLLKRHMEFFEEKIDLVTPEELSCFFQHLKKFEAEYTLCQKGPTSCLVTDQDSSTILERYTTYYKEKIALNKQLDEKLQLATRKFYADLQIKCFNAGKSFAHAFASTLLDKYFQPYLLNKGMSYSKEITEGLRSALTLLMTQSLFSTMTESMVRHGLKPILMKLGLNLYVVERMLSAFGAAVAFAQNPLSLVDLGLNGAAATAGENLAYSIIRALPKLKIEPVDNAVSEGATVVIAEQAGLRRRMQDH